MHKRVAMAMLAALPALTACGGEAPDDEAGTARSNRVETSGKTDVPLAEVPGAVLAAARAVRPDFTPAEAETETRDGRLYYDVEGTLPDGSEIEFDIMAQGEGWQVVETQRDIAFAAAPEPVRAAVAARDPSIAPVRVIESRQADGLVIYELFGPASGDAEGTKIEVKFDGESAELLTEEWAH